jgi:selenocysteine lyase/cysteine desulfurase
VTALGVLSNDIPDVESMRSYQDDALSMAARMTGRSGPDSAVFTSSTSAGLFQLAFALSGGPDAELLVSPKEFPANVYPWVRAAERGGPRVTWLRTPDGRVTPDAVAAALTPSTAALAVSAVDFRTGYRADLAGLREVLGERLLLLDGIQGFGACDVDWSLCDAVVVGGQKWVRSSWGTGFISLAPRGQDRLGSGLSGFSGVENPTLYDDSLHETLTTAGRLAMTNPDLVAASCLAAALTLIDGITVSAIDREIQLRVEALLDVIENLGGATIVPLAPGERSGIVSFRLPGATAEQIGGALAEVGVVASVRGDYVRLSPHATTPLSSTDAVDKALRSLSH